jgi:hypothetical protein
MCDPVRTMFSIKQNVHTKFNRLNGSLHGPDDQVSYMEIACTSSTVRTSPFRVRTLQSLIMVITCSQSATVQTLGQHCLDVALLWELSVLFWKGGCSWPSGRSVKPSELPQDARSSLPDALRYLIITFYTNIGLGQNRCCWKANKKCCQLTVQMATIASRWNPSGQKDLPIWTALQKIPELLSRQENLDPSGRPKAPVQMRVF